MVVGIEDVEDGEILEVFCVEEKLKLNGSGLSLIVLDSSKKVEVSF